MGRFPLTTALWAPRVLAVAALAACRASDAPRPADSATVAVPPAAPTADAGPVQYVATVVRSYPHDPSAFTEGLFLQDGRLFESTGLNGKSDVREVDLPTGAVKHRTPLDSAYFGEGIAAHGGTLYQLTWKDGRAFTYDLATLARRPATRSYTGEGWGMTTDGESLVMSDGTARLRFLDPQTFAVRRTVDVRDGASPVSQLNELEWVKGRILANVWQSNQLVEIDPQSGAVTGWIDASAVPAPADKTGREDVLNGIAYDAAADKLYLTGKYFTRLYEVRLDRR
jgi:glutamine cyclotransferase